MSLDSGATISGVPVKPGDLAVLVRNHRQAADVRAALGDAIRSCDVSARVLVLASGGLSHWLPSNDPRVLPDERRAPLIHGRQDARAFAAAREPRVRALGGNPAARVNADWDRWFLRQLEAAETGPVLALGDHGLEEAAGSGGHEVRTWLAGLAAAGRPLVWTSYEPVREWITGMGIGTTFEMTL